MGNASSMDTYGNDNNTVLINNNLTTTDYSDIKKQEEIQNELIQLGPDDSVLIGGYKQKYLKYKQKYLMLKN